MQIQNILAERGNNYGEFEQHARITQAMKDAMKVESLGKYPELQDYMKEALEMICHKIGRIVNGNPYYLDNWRDLVGYSQLVIDIVSKTEGATDSRVVKQHVVNGKLVDIS